MGSSSLNPEAALLRQPGAGSIPCPRKYEVLRTRAMSYQVKRGFSGGVQRKRLLSPLKTTKKSQL